MSLLGGVISNTPGGQNRVALNYGGLVLERVRVRGHFQGKQKCTRDKTWKSIEPFVFDHLSPGDSRVPSIVFYVQTSCMHIYTLICVAITKTLSVFVCFQGN